MKYYGTLGPSCADTEVLRRMMQEGMTGIRLNLSHKSLQESEEWIFDYFMAADQEGIKVDFLIDLMGPELRIGTLEAEMILGEKGKVLLGGKQIPIPEVIKPYLVKGQRILLDDGKIELQAAEDGKEQGVVCHVIQGGVLRSNKSILLPGCQIDQPTLTPMDLENLSLAKKYGVTEVMLPFARGKEDLRSLRCTLNEIGSRDIRIFAKIENLDGVRNLEEMIPESDCIVIARGDLGNAVPLTMLPCIQDQIATICRKYKKDFMVVTQMLDSMMHHPYPTRAEVSDIFQAVMQGASSLMLTGETAVGEYPVKAMEMLAQTGRHAETYRREKEKQENNFV